MFTIIGTLPRRPIRALLRFTDPIPRTGSATLKRGNKADLIDRFVMGLHATMAVGGKHYGSTNFFREGPQVG